jgi:hypothetical protein
MRRVPDRRGFPDTAFHLPNYQIGWITSPIAYVKLATLTGSAYVTSLFICFQDVLKDRVGML